ncbi:MAG: glycosyltransferase family 87 protein, partial [Bryobacteraceae bacterium]
AVGLFIWLWPIGRRSTVAAVCCWSFPIFTALAQGQDDSFLLAVIGIAVCLMRAGRPFAAGLVFALCASKFQLFLLVPFWIVAQRLWQFGRGFVTGAGCLVAVSFLAGGLRWPLRFLALLTDPVTNPSGDVMPNLYGIFAQMPHGLTLEIASAVGISAVALWSFRRMSFEYGLAMTTAAGILIGHHAYVNDCAILIPGLLILYWQAKTAGERLFAVVMFTPFVYIGSLAGPVLVTVTRLTLVSFVGLLAWIAGRSARPPAAPAPSSPGV